ncbi:hypothetical protein Leryth_012841 [Lithospermum erythrorhizon]|nr:hypothetical protein Leryth_012841 [Lithospermum erythrorhizon]
MAFLNRVSGVLRQTTSNHMPVELSASSTSLFQAIRNMSSKLFIGGLSFGTDEMSLREAFSQHGEVVEARIIMDRETGRSRGFGFVTFTSSEEASSAIGALDGQELHGRRIKVNLATERPRGGGFRGDFGGVGGGYGNNNYGGSGGYGNNNYRGAGGYGDGGYGGNAGGYGNTSTYGGNPGGGYGNNNYGGQPGYDNNYGSSNNMINHDNITSGFSGQYGGGAGGDTSTPTGDYFNTGIDGGSSVPDQGESGDGRTAVGNQN